jgi:hypothetical protein
MGKNNPAHRPILSRFREIEFEELENWRRAQPVIPNLSEAVRFLTNMGIKASPEKRAAKERSITS